MKGYGFSKTPDNPQRNKKQYRYQYNSIFRLTSNRTIESITFRFKKKGQYGLEADKDYSLALYNEGDNSWESISSEEVSEDGTVYLEGSVTDISADKDYYFTLFEEEEGRVWDWVWPIIIFAIIALIGLIIILSKKDYIRKIKQRITHVEKGPHRLSLEEVLENENRSKIIDLILTNPGIHLNELLRETDLSPGNLVWHLDILEKYEIIGKKHVSNYVVYFPYYQKNPLSNLDLKLRKSELTLKVLELIEEKPGMWNNKMAEIFDVDHKTTKYHLDKLMELDLIFSEKDGRKKKYYPNLENEYFNNDTE
jgi:predicted transcriptional regulator